MSFSYSNCPRKLDCNRESPLFIHSCQTQKNPANPKKCQKASGDIAETVVGFSPTREVKEYLLAELK
jgi:hypothetical protein